MRKGVMKQHSELHHRRRESRKVVREARCIEMKRLFPQKRKSHGDRNIAADQARVPDSIRWRKQPNDVVVKGLLALIQKWTPKPLRGETLCVKLKEGPKSRSL